MADDNCVVCSFVIGFLDALLYINFNVRGCGCECDECGVHKLSSMLILLQKDMNVVRETGIDVVEVENDASVMLVVSNTCYYC